MKRIASLVILITLLWASFTTAVCVHEQAPELLLFAALNLLFVAAIAMQQYRAAFHHRASAAWAAGVMLRIGAVLLSAIFSFFLGIAALYGAMLEVAWYVVALGAISGCAFLFYAANRNMRLHRSLQQQKADNPEFGMSSGLSLRELLMATTIVALFAGTTMGLVRWIE